MCVFHVQMVHMHQNQDRPVVLSAPDLVCLLTLITHNVKPIARTENILPLIQQINVINIAQNTRGQTISIVCHTHLLILSVVVILYKTTSIYVVSALIVLYLLQQVIVCVSKGQQVNAQIIQKYQETVLVYVLLAMDLIGIMVSVSLVVGVDIVRILLMIILKKYVLYVSMVLLTLIILNVPNNVRQGKNSLHQI